MRSQKAAQTTSHGLLRCQDVLVKRLFKVLSEFEFLSFVTILVFEFYHNLSFLVWLLFEYLSFLLFKFGDNLSF